MIVRYVRERGYKGEGKDPSVTIGRDYIALGVTFRSDNYLDEVSLRRDSDGTPVLFELKYFDIIDGRIPYDWMLMPISVGHSLEPKEFFGDFWDLYHDGDEEADKLFEFVVKKTEGFHEIDEIDGVSVPSKIKGSMGSDSID